MDFLFIAVHAATIIICKVYVPVTSWDNGLHCCVKVMKARKAWPSPIYIIDVTSTDQHDLTWSWYFRGKIKTMGK